MKRISGGQTSVKARGQAPIKSRRLILGRRRRATQRIPVTPASKPGRSTASYRVSPPPARGPTSRVGRHRPSARTLTQRPVIHDHQLEGWSIGRGFPLPFGRRHSLLGHPIPAGELGPPHGRLTGPQGRTPTGLPRSAHTSYDRVGCPLYPGDDGAHPGPVALTGRRLPRSQRPVPVSRSSVPSIGNAHYEASTRVQAIHPSGLPLACRRPDGTDRGLGFSLSFGPRRPGAGRRTSGWGQAIEHGPETTLYDISRTSNPACLLVVCDLASHGRLRKSEGHAGEPRPTTASSARACSQTGSQLAILRSLLPAQSGCASRNTQEARLGSIAGLW